MYSASPKTNLVNYAGHLTDEQRRKMFYRDSTVRNISSTNPTQVNT